MDFTFSEGTMRRSQQILEQSHVTHEDHMLIVKEQSHVEITCKAHVPIPKEKYKELAEQLEKWNIQYRGFILKNYPVDVVKEAIARTKFKEQNLRIPGAYFNKVIRSLYKVSA